MVGYQKRNSVPPKWCKINDKKYTFPRHFLVKLSQSDNIEVFSMAFVREIERNGVLYSGIWPRQRVSNRFKSNRYNEESISINQIEKKGISMTSL